jgi:DNA-directed RNA polymerase specialized sigma24 family protein
LNQECVASNFELAQIAYNKKIKTFASNSNCWAIPGYQEEDIEAEITEVLWQCVKQYNPDNGARFNSYFWQSAKNRLISINRFHSRQKRCAEVTFLSEDVLERIMNDLPGNCEFSAEDFALANMEVETRRRKI